ncbi:MAG: Histidinol-phosphatase [Alphaproteobacteria bacterium ADurb.BinA280]|jgi:histidinol-phosphatase|nr:MAG: Histidinol-phosphatase [Alphaproteobacteria bacterium ADurb.BinA280]
MTQGVDDHFLERALQVAKTAAQRAGELINRYYGADVDVILKDDASPVTCADIESEKVIRDVLLEAFPTHAIYGEEHGLSGEGDFLWLVDPIDGTKSFVRRYPMFSTQIALMHRGELVLGVSCASAFGELAWAVRGGGAWLDGKRIGVADIKLLAQATLSTGNLKSLAGAPGWAALAGLVQEVSRVRGYGDFLHYHLLARGALDLVIESDVNILDVAALAVIVREAGGVFTDLDGRELDLQTRSVLAGTAALHQVALHRMHHWREGTHD